MMKDSLLSELKNTVLPKHYRNDLSEKVESDYLLFTKGSYVTLVMPFSCVPDGDFGSSKAKSIIRNAMRCIPFFWEKGLFLIYYGDEDKWLETASNFTVDKTAFRPVILQSIHFIDPSTGANLNSRTHWGPLKFGFCGKLIEELEHVCRNRT